MIRRLWPLLSLLLLIAAVALAGSVLPPQLQRVTTNILIAVCIVVGLFVFAGNSGITSFGHAGFAAIGAYIAAWFTMPVAMKMVFLPKLPSFVLERQLSLVPAACIGMAAAAVIALLVGMAIVRLSGVAASIGTLSFLAIVNIVFSNADALTKGTSSLIGIPVATTPTVTLEAALLVTTLAWLFQQSRLALVLRASREDAAAAQSCGVNVKLVRLIAFVLSAAIVGLGGVLQGHFLGILTVDSFFMDWTFMALAMLTVGGTQSLSGAVVGAVFIGVVAELLHQLEDGIELTSRVSIHLPSGSQQVGLACILLFVLIVKKSGLTGGREFLLRTSSPQRVADTAGEGSREAS
jgi:branched-chain amino acid transport system permease protein